MISCPTQRLRPWDNRVKYTIRHYRMPTPPLDSYRPPDVKTLVELLRLRADSASHAQQHAYGYLADAQETDDVVYVTYSELDRRARALGAWLQQSGAAGSRALLLYPPGLDYIAAFFGCLYAGVVAVPAYPPRLNRPMPRLQSIVADAEATVALATPTILDSLARRFAHLPDLAALQWLDDSQVPQGLESAWRDPKDRAPATGRT